MNVGDCLLRDLDDACGVDAAVLIGDPLRHCAEFQAAQDVCGQASPVGLARVVCDAFDPCEGLVDAGLNDVGHDLLQEVSDLCQSVGLRVFPEVHVRIVVAAQHGDVAIAALNFFDECGVIFADPFSSHLRARVAVGDGAASVLAVHVHRHFDGVAFDGVEDLIDLCGFHLLLSV